MNTIFGEPIADILLHIIDVFEDYLIVFDHPNTLLSIHVFPVKNLNASQLKMICYFHDKQNAWASILLLCMRDNTGSAKIYK